MKKRKINILFIVFILLLAAFILPEVQRHTHFIQTQKLSGWFKTYERPVFTTKSWFEGEYQEDFNTYYENNIGLRPIFVRIRNQIAYYLNDEAKAAGVIIGKNRYLFELNYIIAYNGDDYLGYQELKANIDSLQCIRQSLVDSGKNLMVWFAAGKGSFYPEYFPDTYANKASDSTNYKIYKHLLEQSEIPFFDCNEWFLKMKDTSQYALYPQYGIHWSNYGAYLAGDSLLRYVEHLYDIDLPDPKLNRIEVTDKLREPDYDIGQSLNLMFQLPVEPMAYPRFSWDTKDKDSLSVIVIADSFFWQLFGKGFGTTAFRPGYFWYYNQEAHPGNININDFSNYRDEVHLADLVILLATEATLYKFPYGFIQRYYYEE